MASTKTKAVFALGALDLARQVASAWSAKREAERDRMGFGKGLREDVAQLARDARGRLPDHVDWRHLPPWRREPTVGERVRQWAPIAIVIALSTAAVVVAAHLVSRREPTLEPERAAGDSKVVGAIRAGSQAIDAGVTKVVDGGSVAATGTASAVAAGSTAVKAAVVDRAKVEVDERVVQPAKKKAITFGIAGVLGLTLYIIVIAAAVQLLVEAIV